MLGAILTAISRRQRRTTRTKLLSRRRVTLEPLENRSLLAVTAIFIPSAGVLTVIGDSLDNTIAVSRNAAGNILINDGAVSVRGGMPTVANVRLVQTFGLAGNDNIMLDETNGALPRANLFGGMGDDTLTGGSANDFIFGESGNDTLLGKAGLDFLFGGANNDTLTGGTGNDQAFGESGTDRLIWNPGDGSDLNEGGLGVDTIEVNGGNGAETFTVAANGARVRFDRTSPAPFSLNIGTSENLVLNANGGDDGFSAGLGLAALIQITVDGGAGNDTFLGSDGADLFLGGDGNDFVDGNRGNDIALLGAGDDTFQWDPGDGSDVIEGQDGFDTMLFNGSNTNENIDISANGARIRFFRDVASIVMDLGEVEAIDFNAFGGSDTIIVNDLSGTDAVEIDLDLAAVGGGGDAQPDSVILQGTNGADSIEVLGSAGSLAVTGLPAFVTISDVEAANDSLVVGALGGDDTISAATLAADIIGLTVDGGAGDDDIFGSDGADILLGGDGNDFIDGQRGNDIALLGAGDDTFVWNPGDGSDTIEGQEGLDTMLFNGAGASENIDISANGARLRFFRDLGSITMDTDDVEIIDFNALGGADTIAVNDLSGTDVTEVNLDLGVIPTSLGDGQPDTVIVNGTNGDDVAVVAGDASGVSVLGLAAQVNITHSEPANDRLTINALAGDDVVDATGLAAGAIQLTADGGAGDDVLIGSDGDDVLSGGDDDDVLIGGPGVDVLDGGPGSNIEIQD